MAHDINFANDSFRLQVAEATEYRETFLLWRKKWKDHNLTIPLVWKAFPFSSDSINSIPDEPGVYAFCVEPSIFNDFKPCYLMYIGETSRTLRQRFREYLREASNSDAGRGKIYMTLNLYEDHLYFYCAPLQTGIEPKDVEKELLQTFIPPNNDKLPVEVGRIVRVLRS